MALPVNDIVNVTVALGTITRQAEFGRTLFLNDINFIVDSVTPGPNNSPSEQRTYSPIRVYRSLSAVQADFQSGNVFDAASIYFQQNPFPKPLVVAPWFRGGRNGALINVAPGSYVSEETLTLGQTITPDDVPDAISNFSNSAVINFSVGGQATGAIDLSSVTTMKEVSDAIQTGIRTVDGSAVCEVIEDGIDIQFSNGITNVVKLEATAGTAAANSRYVLSLIGQQNPIVYGLIAPNESGEDALGRIFRENADFYFICARSSFSSEDDGIEIATWAQNNNRSCYIGSSDPAVLVAGDSSSNAATALGRSLTGWFMLWNEGDYAGLAAAAKMSSWDLDSLGIGYTLDGKVLIGVDPSNLTTAQQDELTRKNVSYYESLGSLVRVVGGNTFGSWADAKYWIDWFQNRLQFELLRLMSVLPVIPYTDRGMDIVLDKITEVCEEGVRNGGISPGQLSSELAGTIRQITRNESFDGRLDTGYMIYAQPVAEVAQSDRDVRRGPDVSVWLKGTGAIQSLEINVSFEN